MDRAAADVFDGPVADATPESDAPTRRLTRAHHSTGPPRPCHGVTRRLAGLRSTSLLDRFEVVEGPSMDGHEPKRITLERALQRLGIAGGPHVVMVGDRRHDLEAGRTHSTATVGVT